MLTSKTRKRQFLEVPFSLNMSPQYNYCTREYRVKKDLKCLFTLCELSFCTVLPCVFLVSTPRFFVFLSVTKKRYLMAFFWSTVLCMDVPPLAVRQCEPTKTSNINISRQFLHSGSLKSPWTISWTTK